MQEHSRFLTFRSLVAEYFGDMRCKIAEEFKNEDNSKFSQAQLDTDFLKTVSRKVSSESLGHSFKPWFLRTFNCLDVDDLSKAKDRSKFPTLEHQYLALLIVYAIAMTEVNTNMDFLSCLVSDEKLDPVWHCVAIILFGLSESKVRHVLRSKTVFVGAPPNTHVVIACCFLFCSVQSLHNLECVHKAVKNGRHFLNHYVGKNRSRPGRHLLKLNLAKMLKKVACLAVYQIAAFAFVHDVQYFMQRCNISSVWMRMVVRLRDDVFNFRVDAHDGNSAADNEITPLVRSKVQKSIGYAVLCKFMVLTVAKVVSSPDRLPAKAARRKRQDPSSDVLPPDVPVVRLAEELTEAKAAFKNLFESVNSLIEKTLGVLTTSSQNLAGDPHGSSAKRGPPVKRKKKACVHSEKPAPAAKKKQKLDSVSSILNEKVLCRPETDHFTLDEETDTEEPCFSFGEEKEQKTDRSD
jgi:hypothetical protein